MKKEALVLAFSALVLVGAGCKSAVDSSANADTMPTAEDGVVPEGVPGVDIDVTVGGEAVVTPSVDADIAVATGDVKTFTVNGGNFAFAPSTMSVKKGDKVKIIFKNDEGFHDLKIDEFNVATPQIKAGEEAVVEFVADKAGSFEYYCTVGKHRAMGMKGTLTVTE